MDEIEETYHEREANFEGYCTSCADWTRYETEPDAEGYNCPVCGQNTVVGVDVWLMSQGGV